jgi:hypothetical protein
MAETQIIQNLPPEYIQQGYQNLLTNVQDYVGGAQPLPDFQLAGMSPAQQQAIKMAYAQQGYQYDPTTGFTPTGAGPGYQSALNAGIGAMGLYGQQAGQLYGQAGAAQFDPTSASKFMTPYMDTITAEINKQAQLSQNQAAAQQAMGGVYGGSRGQIQSGMIDRNRMDTIAGAQSDQYNQAMQQAMMNFQNQQGRGLQAAQGLGALGMGLGQGYGQQAQLQNQLATQGIGQMMGIGGQQQQLAQQQLDIGRGNILQAQNQPMALYGFMSDILGGAPSTMGYQYQQTYGQPGSPFSQMLGTGATLLGGLGTLGKL